MNQMETTNDSWKTCHTRHNSSIQGSAFSTYHFICTFGAHHLQQLQLYYLIREWCVDGQALPGHQHELCIMASADDLLLILASSCPNKLLVHKSECSCQSRGLKLQPGSSAQSNVCSRWLYAFGAAAAHLEFCTVSDVMSQRLMWNDRNTNVTQKTQSQSRAACARYWSVSYSNQRNVTACVCIYACWCLCCCGGIVPTTWD